MRCPMSSNKLLHVASPPIMLPSKCSMLIIISVLNRAGFAKFWFAAGSLCPPYRGRREELIVRQALYPCEIFIAACWTAANAIEGFTGGATTSKQADRDED
jgi:hypothetical protein